MTKGELIRQVKKNLQKGLRTEYGICYAMYQVCIDITKSIYVLFPELGSFWQIIKYRGNPFKYLYWRKGVWNKGRLKFFNMLYEKYKDDNTEI